MARTKDGLVCHHHRNKVSYEDHHVFPRGYGGPDVASNRIRICCNAHSDIHYLMDRMITGKPNKRSEYGRTVWHYAEVGYWQVMAHLKKHPTLEITLLTTGEKVSHDAAV